MRDTHVQESGMIPGATWEESVLLPAEPREIQSVEMIYGQRREIVCIRNITREELDAATEEFDGRGNRIGYRVHYRLNAAETIRFLPQSEYRVQAKMVLSDGTVKKSYMIYCITADTDEYADKTEEEEEDGGI